jgi:hypothetical protein
MSTPAAKPQSATKPTAKSKSRPVRIGRSAATGQYILEPYPKKGGTDPKIIRAVVEAVIASRKA